MINPEHIPLLSCNPLDILPKLIKDNKFDFWADKATWLRNNINQDSLISFYLIVFLKMEELVKDLSVSNEEIGKYLESVDIFWCSLTDENAAKVELQLNK